MSAWRDRVRRVWNRIGLAWKLYFFLLALLVAGGIAIYCLDPPERTGRFTILQVNDLYRIEGVERGRIGGLARVRALRKALEAEGNPVLTLHAGDFLYPSVMSKYTAAAPMVRILNLLDGDEKAFDDRMIVTFGNHEFDQPRSSLKPQTKELLLARIVESGFHWVSSDIHFRSTANGTADSLSKQLKNVHDDLVTELDGVRVGILGLTVPGSDHEWVEYRHKERNRIVSETLRRWEREGVQVRIALTHQDMAEDRALARDFPELDLIVGGHDHAHLQERIGKTWITKADADARSAVRIDVAVLPGGRVLAAPQKIDLLKPMPEDPIVQAAVKQELDNFAAVYAKESPGRKLVDEVGKTQLLLEGVEPAVRGRETALGNFLADKMREKMQTEIAFINGGSIRINDNVPPGPFTWGDLEGIFYYDNDVVPFELDAEDLLEILRNGVSQADNASGRFLHVSGLRFWYHVDRSTGSVAFRVDPKEVWISKGASEVTLNELMAKREKLTAATCGFLWDQGEVDGFKFFEKARKQTVQNRLGSEDWRKLLEAEIRKGISSKVEGRIVRIEG